MWETLRSALQGTPKARAAHQAALARKPGIVAAMRELQQRCPAPADDGEEPIFLLSAGWRSGSTMLQRLIMSDRRVLMWGEPYDECGLIQALADSMRAFREGWPPREYFYDGRPHHELSGEWIANLFPSLEDWRLGQRALLDTMFALPARRAGATRWGVKEVRLTGEHALYLRWLYPRARFVCLYRDPLEAYRSYCHYGRDWYDVFPDKPMFTPTAFGTHWCRLMESFEAHGPAVEALMVRYEDLVGGRMPLAELERHLSIQVDASLLDAKVGSSERGGKKATVGALESWLLKRGCGSALRRHGYGPGSAA
jgi:Sulfotransferase family